MISPEYLAGVIDSDGSISVSKRHITRKNPNYIVMIQLTWLYNDLSLEVISEMVNKYGGSYYIGKSHSSYDKDAADIIKYCGVGKAAGKLLEDIKDHLRLKKKQCDNGLSLLKVISTYHNPRPVEASNILEELYLHNKLLNGKNK